MAYGNSNTQNQGLTSEGNQSGTNTQSTSTNSLQSGSNQVFPLSKTIISNQTAKDILSDTFKEVIISEEKFDSKKIKGIYNDLFYQIPKTGKKSHTSIIEQSTDYVYPEINENYEDSIDSLTNDIVELSKSSSILSTPIITPQHPIYDNGTLVQEGDVQGNFALDPSSPIWFIQQGMKRKLDIHSRGYYVRALRQSQGENVYDEKGGYKPLINSPYFRFLDDDDLNTIDDGTPITTGNDFNTDPILKIDQEYIYSDIDLELTCEGKERFYKFKQNELGYVAPQFYADPMNIEGGYWYVDPEGYCEIEVWQEIPPSHPFYSQLGGFAWKGIKWKGGTKKQVNFSRDEKYYGHSTGPKGITDPLDTEFYKDATANLGKFYATNVPAGFLGNYRNLPKHYIWKWWGEENLFPGIRYVKPGSRIKYRMKSPYNADGVVFPGSHWLNGYIDGSTVNAPEQYNTLNSYYDKESNFGSKMIHRNCYGPLDAFGCFGKLNQSNSTQRVMNDVNDRYYHKQVSAKYTHGVFPAKYDVTTTGKVYGQPILKMNNGSYVVFLGAYSTGFGLYDWNIFYNLDTGGYHKIKNKNLDDEIKGYKRDSKALFNWIRSDGDVNSSTPGIRVNNPTIYFPGLKGEGVNFENTDLDSFPATGFLGSIFSSWIAIAQFLNDFAGGDGKDNPFNPKNSGNNYKLEQEIADNIHME